MRRRPAFFLCFCAILIGTFGCQPKPKPVNGAPGMGDPYYKNLGNGGYNVQRYVIALNVDPLVNRISGSTTITAIATENLGSFNVDFHGLTVDSVSVNDQKAEFSRNGDELTINPSDPLGFNGSFTVVIGYHGSPGLISSQAALFQMGWSHASDGSINVWGEPDAASAWFPNNNHPRDKAAYRFEITVPKPWVVAATGTLKETKDIGDKTTFIWEMDKPMASYLASINIDHYELFTQTGPNGMSIRNYYPMDFPVEKRVHYNVLPAMVDFFDDLFGPYPFDEYGVVVASAGGLCAHVELALEAQSMSIHCPSQIMSSERVIAHELAHQWFGDSVSLENWKDIWLKEGFASYSEWLWEGKNDPVALARIAKARRSQFLDSDLPVAEPAARDLYTDESYTGGALVLHALRLQVGDETFFKVLRTYIERYRYENAGTDEFIAIAEDVSGRDLKEFFSQWLFGGQLPDLSV
jgi:aminopeptidase N